MKYLISMQGYIYVEYILEYNYFFEPLKKNIMYPC